MGIWIPWVVLIFVVVFVVVFTAFWLKVLILAFVIVRLSNTNAVKFGL